MKTFGKFASEVYRMICNNPSKTAGELFQTYKINHPDTIRSRNEVAKRISELKEDGVVRADGKRSCDFTGFYANTWTVAAFVSSDVRFSTEEAEQQRVQPQAVKTESHAWDEDDACVYDVSRQETARKVAEAAGEKVVAMDSDDEAFLRQFRTTLAELKTNPLFSRLAPAKMKSDAEKLEKALRYF